MRFMLFVFSLLLLNSSYGQKTAANNLIQLSLDFKKDKYGKQGLRNKHLIFDRSDSGDKRDYFLFTHDSLPFVDFFNYMTKSEVINILGKPDSEITYLINRRTGKIEKKDEITY